VAPRAADVAGSGTQRKRSDDTIFARALDGDLWSTNPRTAGASALACALSPLGCAGHHLAVRSGELEAEARLAARTRIEGAMSATRDATRSVLGEVSGAVRESAAPLAEVASITRWAAVAFIALALLIALGALLWFFGPAAKTIADVGADALKAVAS
jgi:hypothetical protein